MTELTMLGQVLHEEHFRILVCISDLQNRVSGDAAERPFDPHSQQDRDEMLGLLGAVDRIVTHHAFEEDEVFPLIRADGDAALADLLTRDHALIEPVIRRLRSLATEILRHGAGDGCWAEFCEVANDLFAEMLAHLEIEEATIVQRLDHLLDAETDQQLAVQHLSSRMLPAVATSSGVQR
jgi:hemerythrin-like domain-containing protein